MISQNLGAGKPRRAFAAFWWILAINAFLGFFLMGLSLLFLDQLALFFAGDNLQFAEMIKDIYRYEAMGAVPLGINSAVLGLLYGFGKTRITLLMNFCRVFVFRIPVLWWLQNFTNFGRESAGIVMAVSNILSGLLAAAVALIELYRISQTMKKDQ